jgi:hypothetical protein
MYRQRSYDERVTASVFDSKKPPQREFASYAPFMQESMFALFAVSEQSRLAKPY